MNNVTRRRGGGGGVAEGGTGGGGRRGGGAEVMNKEICLQTYRRSEAVHTHPRPRRSVFYANASSAEDNLAFSPATFLPVKRGREENPLFLRKHRPSYPHFLYPLKHFSANSVTKENWKYFFFLRGERRGDYLKKKYQIAIAGFFLPFSSLSINSRLLQ